MTPGSRPFPTPRECSRMLASKKRPAQYLRIEKTSFEESQKLRIGRRKRKQEGAPLPHPLNGSCVTVLTPGGQGGLSSPGCCCFAMRPLPASRQPEGAARLCVTLGRWISSHLPQGSSASHPKSQRFQNVLITYWCYRYFKFQWLGT